MHNLRVNLCFLPLNKLNQAVWLSTIERHLRKRILSGRKLESKWYQSVKKTDTASGCSVEAKKEIFVVMCQIFCRMSLFTPLVQGLCSIGAPACAVASQRTHTGMHAFSPNIFSTTSNFLFPHSFTFLDDEMPRCAVVIVIPHRRAGRRRLSPKRLLLLLLLCVPLTLRCGSVLRVYTGGKGVNATCFKEVQDVFTSALTGTLGKSWN